jgi:hypothetical protein
VNILEALARRLGRGDPGRGTITLLSELPICDSCRGVIQQFEAYTGVRVIVRAGPMPSR